MSEFNAHLSARGASRRSSATSSTSGRHSAPAPLHIDIDDPPEPWRFAPFIALLLMIFFLFLQFMPATHYRDPFDSKRVWKSFSPDLTAGNQTVTHTSTQSEPLEDVHIFSWSDDLDLRPLAVLVNSSISNTRNPGNIFFYLSIPDDWEEELAHYRFKVLFPKSNIFVHRHSVIRKKVLASGGEDSRSDFPYFLPFYIPKISQNLRRFIYLVPDIVVKGKVEELFRVNLTNTPVAAVEDCSNNFEYVNAKSSRPLVAQTPYGKSTCILDFSVLLVNAELFTNKNFIEVTKLWRKGLDAEDERDGGSDQAIMLALDGNYTKLDASWNRRESRFSGIGSDVKIFHFDGEKKPWLKQTEDSIRTNMTKIWWDYLSGGANLLLRQPNIL